MHCSTGQSEKRFESMAKWNWRRSVLKTLWQCPSYILLQEDIGGKFVGMEMSEKAIRCFKKVVAAAPTNTYALNQLGILYGVSDPKKSAKYYKKLLKLEPENESAKRALE